jgi:cbb3-type cytochrome oxidase subunit 3
MRSRVSAWLVFLLAGVLVAVLLWLRRRAGESALRAAHAAMAADLAVRRKIELVTRSEQARARAEQHMKAAADVKAAVDKRLAALREDGHGDLADIVARWNGSHAADSERDGD